MWFPNNTWIVSPSSGPRSILKVKAKVIPRKLQPWQAYHALTYESHWKSSVNTAWAEYKDKWAAEHPGDKKPPKMHFQIMVDFINSHTRPPTLTLSLIIRIIISLTLKGLTHSLFYRASHFTFERLHHCNHPELSTLLYAQIFEMHKIQRDSIIFYLQFVISDKLNDLFVSLSKS